MRMLLKPLVLDFIRIALHKHRIIWQGRLQVLNFHPWHPRTLLMVQPSTLCTVLLIQVMHMPLIPIILGTYPTMVTLTIRELLPHQLTTLP